MTNTKLKATFIKGRFHILGEQHTSSIREAAKKCDHTAFFIEASDRPISIYDPFTGPKRITILNDLMKGVSSPEKASLSFATLTSVGDVGDQLEHLVRVVQKEISYLEEDLAESLDVTLVGFTDAEVAALGDNYKLADINLPSRNEEIALTERYLEDADFQPVSDLLAQFRLEASYEDLVAELRNKRKLNAQYGTGPFHTADAICLHKDRVLVIRRGNHPFKGMLALPGGIVDAGEDYVAAAIRELIEETQISVEGRNLTDDEIRSCIVTLEPLTIDDQLRDPRGHYIAHATVFDFSKYEIAPEVYGADDAVDAKWHEINRLKPNRTAFDHYEIIDRAVGITNVQDLGVGAAPSS